jgi:hypothetical protein
MNVAMENTKEVVDGQVTASFGDAFIRGNNGQPAFPGSPLQTAHFPDSPLHLGDGGNLDSIRISGGTIRHV